MGGKLDTNSGGKMAADGELVTLTLADLQPFSRHPYKVRDDEAMRDMVESIKQYGVLSPAIARPMLYRCNGRLVPYADKRFRGLFVVKERRTMVTPLGKQVLHDFIGMLTSDEKAAV